MKNNLVQRPAIAKNKYNPENIKTSTARIKSVQFFNEKAPVVSIGNNESSEH